MITLISFAFGCWVLYTIIKVAIRHGMQPKKEKAPKPLFEIYGERRTAPPWARKFYLACIIIALIWKGFWSLVDYGAERQDQRMEEITSAEVRGG